MPRARRSLLRRSPCCFGSCEPPVRLERTCEMCPPCAPITFITAATTSKGTRSCTSISSRSDRRLLRFSSSICTLSGVSPDSSNKLNPLETPRSFKSIPPSVLGGIVGSSRCLEDVGLLIHGYFLRLSSREDASSGLTFHFPLGFHGAFPLIQCPSLSSGTFQYAAMTFLTAGSAAP
jgi:hypothetical protein